MLTDSSAVHPAGTRNKHITEPADPIGKSRDPSGLRERAVMVEHQCRAERSAALVVRAAKRRSVVTECQRVADDVCAAGVIEDADADRAEVLIGRQQDAAIQYIDAC